uniref:Uncharacterized protein n=1 Tax=Anguilla anguilla TaxID=7936 RepID=A0A0E9UPM2_ANGAN
MYIYSKYTFKIHFNIPLPLGRRVTVIHICVTSLKSNDVARYKLKNNFTFIF